MIDRYTLTSTPDQLKANYSFLEEVEPFDLQYNAAPAKQMPVTTMQAPQTVQSFRWGFISALANNKKMSQKLFNTDIAQGISKPSVKKSLNTKRCVIYATGFYMWKLVSKKTLTPHYAHFEPDKTFGIAGFWEEKDEFIENSTDSFMMITRSAARHLSEYQDDMPFILPDDKIAEWLDPAFDVQTSMDWLDTDPSEGMTIYPVAPAINQSDLNNERLIKRSLPADQHGNYTLFG